MDAFFFWLFSIAMIVSGLAVVLNRNPVASAICFAFSIFFMSGLFILLSAYFLAAVQILVTAGAVMVLFLFIIMLLDLSGAEKIPRQRVWMGASMVLALAFIYLIAKTLNATPEGFALANPPPPVFHLQPVDVTTLPVTYGEVTVVGHLIKEDVQVIPSPPDDTHQIGHLLFTTYVAPFEITSLLILVATIGVIVLCKQEEKS